MSIRADFFDLTRAELEGRVRALGRPPLHAGRIFANAYRRALVEPWRDDALPTALRDALERERDASGPRLVEAPVSEGDGAVKLLLELADGARIESVLIPERARLTLCVSSQVGCAQACTFCRTATMGLARQLAAGEIVGQVVAANRWLAAHPDWLVAHGFAAARRVGNVVFMGMGEPLDNVEQVLRALEILRDRHGLCLAARRITVSTAGHVEGLERLVEEAPDVSVALSLHATADDERERLMPINRRWPLAELRAAVERLVTARGRTLFVQYTLLDGWNDSPGHADALAAWLEGLDSKVNLIPFNEAGRSRFAAPPAERVQAFRDRLHAAGFRVMVRTSKGPDVAAACGQLAVR